MNKTKCGHPSPFLIRGGSAQIPSLNSKPRLEPDTKYCLNLIVYKFKEEIEERNRSLERNWNWWSVKKQLPECQKCYQY